jgi:hypothetical protein
VLRTWLLIALAGFLALALAVFYVVGIAWTPGGNAPSSVLHGSGCPVVGAHVSVEGPDDRPDEDADDYAPGHEWAFLDGDPDSLPGARVGGGWGAERHAKAQLPWRVRFRMEWDSEGSLLAAYGSHDDICMLARVIAHERGAP